MNGLVAIGTIDKFAIVPEKVLNTLSTKVSQIVVLYNEALYILHILQDCNDMEEMKQYEKIDVLSRIVC